jgi:ribosome-associated protein
LTEKRNSVLNKIIEIINEKKGENIKVLKVSRLTTIADYIIIVSGNSNRQLIAITEDIEKKLKKAGRKPLSVVGKANAEWILMDYNDILINIFLTKTRDYYNLEELWERDDNSIPLQEFGIQG